MKEKINVVVLFGGQSSEHEVSVVSAKTVISGIDTQRYAIHAVGITKEGNWRYYDGDFSEIQGDSWVNNSRQAILSPDAHEKSLYIIEEHQLEQIQVDVVFPVLHGKYGEDGTVQGLLDLAGIPYVGCGVLSSAVAMDKLMTKKIVTELGIRQAKFVGVYTRNLVDMEDTVEAIEAVLEYPMFVKPSNAGSSVGVSKAHDQKELIEALLVAGKHDYKILVEENITGREVECAVLGNDNPKASSIGEIVASAEFYDYDAKYNSETSETIVGADLPEETLKELQQNSVDIFKAIDGRGLSRVDFFVEEGTGKVIFNEINTLPGFTSISMYPMLWANAGIPIKELVSTLIELAFQ